MKRIAPWLQCQNPSPEARPKLIKYNMSFLKLKMINVVSTLKTSTLDWLHGRVVKFMRSALAAQGFPRSDPGRGHGTAHQAMLIVQPEGPTTRIYNYVLGGL